MKLRPFLLLTAAALLLAGCQKKYEENPLINLHSKNNRVEGSYRLASYLVNGTDSTAALNSALTSPSGEPFVVHFFRTDNKKLISGNTCQGDWELVDEKRFLRINLANSPGSMEGPFVTKEQLDWRITKLTDNHLHMKTEHEGVDYVVWLEE